MRKLTQEEFLAKALAVHGEDYDYSLSEYVNFRTPINILCRKHGIFSQIPRDHLSGKGCIQCGREKTIASKKGIPSFCNRKKLYGVAVNDYPEPIFANGVVLQSYSIWHSMLTRCYSEKYHKNAISYIECKVCDEWLNFSSFKEWFDSDESGYKDDYQLDKDILVKGNKIYSPSTCVFVPQEINSLFCFSNRSRGELHLGVAKNKHRYYAFCENGNCRKYLGNYESIDSAFAAYKTYKEERIRQMAYKYFSEGKITEKVYTAMLNYHIEITD